jgi:hypothetical protein
VPWTKPLVVMMVSLTWSNNMSPPGNVAARLALAAGIRVVMAWHKTKRHFLRWQQFRLGVFPAASGRPGCLSLSATVTWRRACSSSTRLSLATTDWSLRLSPEVVCMRVGPVPFNLKPEFALLCCPNHRISE